MPHVKPFPQDHDQYDMGWHKTKQGKQLHYYRSHEKSRVALAHCMNTQYKTELIKSDDGPKCVACQVVENVRQ